MQFKPILLLGLAAIASSFILPNGAANGLYRAYYNDAGEEVHEPIDLGSFENAATSSLPVVSNAPRSKRQEPQVKRNVETWCGCGIQMNVGDTNVANQRLASQAQSGSRIPIMPGTSVYSIQNTAVAFACSIGPKYAFIDANVVSDYAWQITQACGWWVAGTARQNTYNPGAQVLDYGYMNYWSGLNFCGNAEESQAHSC